MTAERVASLLAYLVPPRRDEVEVIADLDATLAAQLAEAAAAWPTVPLDPEVYLRCLADKLRDRADEPAARVIQTIPASDLHLATACRDGDPAALDAFRAAVMPAVRDALAKLGAPPATIDETEQRVLVMLFVGEGRGRPQIETYAGRGRLRSWVRSVGVRTGRRLMGVDHGGGNADALERLPAALDDPETELLRSHYRDDFRAAFTAAFAGLTERERNLLRQYHLDDLTIDQLATLYQVNRATTARWVAAARRALLDGTRGRLATQLAISTSEVDSIIRLVRSQLDVSIRELFGGWARKQG